MNFQIPDSVSLAFSELNRENRKKENIRFWVPVIISIISLAISIYASLKPIEKQSPLIVKDTVRIIVPYNYPKNESLKRVGKKKK